VADGLLRSRAWRVHGRFGRMLVIVCPLDGLERRDKGS
jgi:hypothetical protein